jgi:hypothetical protein
MTGLLRHIDSRDRQKGAWHWLRSKARNAILDSEQFRSAQRTCRPICGRLRVWQTGRGPRRERAQCSAFRRRAFITLLVGGAATWPLAARAQQPEPMRRIAVLMLYAENDPEGQLRATAFRQGTPEARLGRRPQCSDRFPMGLRGRRLDTIRRRAVAATGAGRDPGQWRAGGEDNAAGEPHGCRVVTRFWMVWCRASPIQAAT